MSIEYKFKYQHYNGADIYESSDGKKIIKYDDLYFDTMGEVSDYIQMPGSPKIQRRSNKPPRVTTIVVPKE
ncbi:MAG: hypothetical protein GX233_03910 [Erysipelothrix sp.]|nr:hypothetical protein [Erysipelothrix sp.]